MAETNSEVLTPEQIEQQLKRKKKYCAHLQIEYSEQIDFIEVEYTSKKGIGRTIMALDPFIINIRSVGEMAGKVWNESLGINVEKEIKFDTTITRYKHQITGIDLIRKQKEDTDDNKLESMVEGLTNTNLSCSVFIHFGPNNSFEINGLDELTAMGIKGKIYKWTLGIF